MRYLGGKSGAEAEVGVRSRSRAEEGAENYQLHLHVPGDQGIISGFTSIQHGNCLGQIYR